MIKEAYYSENVGDVQNIPVKDQQRVRTDIFCIVVNTVFVILLFIISIAVFNKRQLSKLGLPNDGDGNLCGQEKTENHTIIYFPDQNNPLKRVCVSKCPRKTDNQVKCYPTSSSSCKSLIPVSKNNVFEFTRIGLFCFPQDPNDKENLIQKIGISQRYHFLAFYDAMWNSFWISALFSILYVVLIQFFPLKAVPWIILLGGVASVIFGILVLIMATGSIVLRIVFILIFFATAAACFYTLFVQHRRKQVFLCARLIQVSTEVLKTNFFLIGFIPLFIFFFFCLIALVGFEVLASWSFSYFIFQPDNPFYKLEGFGSGFLTFLIAFQFLWGMSFLKQACNFCISGYATHWYYYQKRNKQKVSIITSPKNLVLFHWGSVLGCALLTGLFYVIDFALDFVFNEDTHNNQLNPYDSLNQQKVQQETRGPVDFFNLCRSQTMSYINIISIPYCNAARYCETLSKGSNFYDYSQTTNRVFRLAAHLLIVSIVTLIALGSMKTSGSGDIGGILYIIVISIFTITFFIGLHGDLAEGLLISAFIQQAFLQDRQNRNKTLNIPQKIMSDVYKDDMAQKYENKSIKDLLIDFNSQK